MEEAANLEKPERSKIRTEEPDVKTEENKPLDMQKVRKILNGVSLFFSLGGFLLILIFGFIAYSALDGMEKSVDVSAKSACAGITSAGAAIGDAGDGISSLQGALQNGSAGFGLLADSLQSTAATVSVLDKASGDKLVASAVSMRSMTANLNDSATGFGKMKDSLDGARSAVNGQRDLFCSSKLTDLVGSMKLMLLVILLFMFTVLLVNSLNSAAGVI